MKKSLLCALVLSAISLFPSAILAQTPQKILLNGTWQVITGKGLSELPENGWWDSQVPKDFYSTAIGEASYVWAKRQIDIPQSWQNC